VSYALGVALFITVCVLKLMFFPNMGPGTLLISVLIAFIVFSLSIYALSKIIWINFFVKYDPDFLENK
jgi:hypothetical protein